jgi:hypothetical protein
MKDFARWYESLPTLADTTPDSIRPATDALEEVAIGPRSATGEPSHLVQSYHQRRAVRTETPPRTDEQRPEQDPTP